VFVPATTDVCSVVSWLAWQMLTKEHEHAHTRPRTYAQPVTTTDDLNMRLDVTGRPDKAGNNVTYPAGS